MKAFTIGLPSGHASYKEQRASNATLLTWVAVRVDLMLQAGQTNVLSTRRKLEIWGEKAVQKFKNEDISYNVTWNLCNFCVSAILGNILTKLNFQNCCKSKQKVPEFHNKSLGTQNTLFHLHLMI